MANQLTGEDLLNMAVDMFGTTDITPEQLAYVMDMSKPSTYMLRNHKIKGKPMTFSVPNRNEELARNHRPWQQAIVDDTSNDLVIMKSRQLGLNLSPLS